MEDKKEFDNAIQYFQSTIYNNISNYSKHKMGATFIGIKTNISGIYKLHIYILLFPFVKNEGGCPPYSNRFSNLYFKDICLNVSESFYRWLYEEMKKQNSIVIMSLESNIVKVLPGTGDALIQVDINCNEKKEWMELEYEAWYEKELFNNIFTIQLINPYLYMVPFPVNPIKIRTIKKIYNYLEIL